MTVGPGSPGCSTNSRSSTDPTTATSLGPADRGSVHRRCARERVQRQKFGVRFLAARCARPLDGHDDEIAPDHLDPVIVDVVEVDRPEFRCGTRQATILGAAEHRTIGRPNDVRLAVGVPTRRAGRERVEHHQCDGDRHDRGDDRGDDGCGNRAEPPPGRVVVPRFDRRFDRWFVEEIDQRARRRWRADVAGFPDLVVIVHRVGP